MNEISFIVLAYCCLAIGATSAIWCWVILHRQRRRRRNRFTRTEIRRLERE